MISFLIIIGWMVAALLAGAGFLHLVPKLGGAGRRLTAWLAIAPGLDLVVTYFTAAPLIVGPLLAGWIGLAAAICSQVLAVMIWTFLHGLAHPAARKGPRIIKVLNRLVGSWRNFAAVWVTAAVVPIFWLIRVAELLVWPCLVHLIRFPRYNHGEWVRVSRHKFDNLVGHDLIWCLYCDWMTGVWSLASEMLRNVESFWCPIRFDLDKKCDNCKHDFPDVFNGWVDSDSDMSEVTKVLEEQYGDGRGQQLVRSFSQTHGRRKDRERPLKRGLIDMIIALAIPCLTIASFCLQPPPCCNMPGEAQQESSEPIEPPRPTGDYDVRVMRGWTVRINPDVAEDDPELLEATLEQLDHQLYGITRVIPEKALSRLQAIEIWVELDMHKTACMCYHVSREWLVPNGYNADKEGAVEIGNARAFLEWTKGQPWMVLHELAHGYHDKVFGYDNETIIEGWTRMKDAGTYERVGTHLGDAQTPLRLDQSDGVVRRDHRGLLRNERLPSLRSQ